METQTREQQILVRQTDYRQIEINPSSYARALRNVFNDQWIPIKIKKCPHMPRSDHRLLAAIVMVGSVMKQIIRIV